MNVMGADTEEAAAQPRIAAVVVTHNPDLTRLRQALAAVGPQVERVFVVDNGSRPDLIAGIDSLGTPRCVLHLLGDNRGIGAAQNRGIVMAREAGSSHVLLLDQDSVPAPDMVTRLTQGLQAVAGDGMRVAAVGPVQYDARNRRYSYFVRFGRLLVRRWECEQDSQRIAADFLIASGMLLPIAAWESVGPFDEGLFIDYVDTDWCFRARAAGWLLFGVCAARLEHALGEDVRRLWFGRWRNLYVHAPQRQYYITRNRLIMYSRRYTPWVWIAQDSLWALLRLLLFALLVPPRRRHLLMMWRGLRDGMQKRVGAYTS